VLGINHRAATGFTPGVVKRGASGMSEADFFSMQGDKKLNVLVLCCGANVHIGVILDHLHAIASRSSHNIQIMDATYCAEAAIDPSWFDVLVLHYSLVISDPNHIRPSLAARIRAFEGLKVAFIQDEYRWVDRQNAAIEHLGVSVLYTVIPPDVARRVYRTPYFDTVRMEHTLTGFVPETLLSVETPDYEDRPIDVSYRARRMASCWGAFSEEKFTIGQRFLRDVEDMGLACDIEWAEGRRIHGADWVKFVSSSKATLGTESGVSFVDFTGKVQEESEAYERARPEASAAEVREKFLGGKDGDICIKVISPRVFEAAALRTLLILYPGNYSGAVIPWRHYVPLSHDHSNVREVVEIIRSPERARPIIEAAYAEVACNPKWQLAGMVADFDRVISDEHGARIGARRLARDRLANDLANQWDVRISMDVTAAELNGYRNAHGEVVDAYGRLSDGYQQLRDSHSALVGQYSGLVGTYQGLAAHYQKLASQLETIAHDHERLQGEHQNLLVDNQRLAQNLAIMEARFEKRTFTGLKRRLRTAIRAPFQKLKGAP
jgi:hypothetical protein